jgi:hypothetical protein
MGRIGAYITQEERLRRIGDLLLKGIYLWADALEGVTVGENGTHEATDRRAAAAEPPCAGDETHRAGPMRSASRASRGADRPHGLGQSRQQGRERQPRTMLRSGTGMPPRSAIGENPDRKRGKG